MHTGGSFKIQGDEDLQTALTAQFNNCKKQDFTVVVLKKKDFDAYSTVKRAGDIVAGQHTMCIDALKSEKQRGEFARAMYFANLALKVNMKAGGDNWTLQDDDLNKILGSATSRNQTLILGADVTHPGAGSRAGAPSIACVVGTVDNKFMKYFGSMRLQAGNKELIDESHFQSMIKERIRD
ncbi:hypothetical protein BU23DRAFT_664261 [Bimuria novae-zelandiae CBS 107.79]|uniref:Piwi domain-containing protein n=1 Tax=Bimuria novae-zelandiae CBS 107.79 TaxID=1447943 RepID=A0A6A5UM20_9PLEO|nr:hypothetical protein BU23DRAFT_664261 [Bimuria novae-zelandiae CBS 107.79]